MRTFKLTFSLLMIISFGHAQTVTIPDTLFRNALIDVGVDIDDDSLIQVSEALAVTKLVVYAKEITDLTGIEAFTNLTYLACDTNNLTSLDVSNNLLLDTLHCQVNQISELDVSMLPRLIRLNCALNRISEFDPSSNLELIWFDIGGNRTLSELDITKNTKLEDLDIVFCNSLNSIDLSHNLDLKVLLVQQNLNNLTSLDVSLNTKLEIFDVTSPITIGTVSPKTICVSEEQIASIPDGWKKSEDDTYTTTNCLSTLTAIEDVNMENVNKGLLYIYTLTGQKIKKEQLTNGIFIFHYDDGSVEKKVITQ